MRKIIILFIALVLSIIGCNNDRSNTINMKDRDIKAGTYRESLTGEWTDVVIDKDKVERIILKSKCFEDVEVKEDILTGEKKDGLIDELNKLKYIMAIGDLDRDGWENWIILEYKDPNDKDIRLYELMFYEKGGMVDGVKMIFEGYDREVIKKYLK